MPDWTFEEYKEKMRAFSNRTHDPLASVYLLENNDIEHIIDSVKSNDKVDFNKQELGDELAIIACGYFYRLASKRANRSLIRIDGKIKKVMNAAKFINETIKEDSEFICSNISNGYMNCHNFPSTETAGIFQYVINAQNEVKTAFNYINKLSDWALRARLLSISKIIEGASCVKRSEAHEWLFHKSLHRVFEKYFVANKKIKGKPGVSRNERTGKVGGPYLRFCVAFAEKYHIFKENGEPFKEETIASFIKARAKTGKRRGA